MLQAKFPQIFRRLEWDGDGELDDVIATSQGIYISSPGMIRASDLFDDDADAKVLEVKAWLKDQGVQDFEHASIFADQLNRVCGFHLLRDLYLTLPLGHCW